MANSQDSTSIDHSSPSFSRLRLIQAFPRHDAAKLDEKNFVQWQQHIRLITEGHELQGLLEGTLPAPPRFVASPATKMACDVWSIANWLFAASTGAKISRIKHELQSLKKGELTVTEYIAKVQNTCALLEASGSIVSEAEKVEVILAGLSSEFDAVLTLASFSSETLSFQILVDVLLEFVSRQTRAVQDIPMHANLVEAPSAMAVTEFDLRAVRGGRSSSGSCERGFRPQMQCQICGRYGHLAQRCFYRFNHDYGGLSDPTTARFPSTHTGQGLLGDFSGRSATFSGPGQHAEIAPTHYPGGLSWGGWPPSSTFGSHLSYYRVPHSFLFPKSDGVGYVADAIVGSNGGPHVSYGPYVRPQIRREFGSYFGYVFGYGLGYTFGRDVGQQHFGLSAGVPRPNLHAKILGCLVLVDSIVGRPMPVQILDNIPFSLMPIM